MTGWLRIFSINLSKLSIVKRKFRDARSASRQLIVTPLGVLYIPHSLIKLLQFSAELALKIAQLEELSLWRPSIWLIRLAELSMRVRCKTEPLDRILTRGTSCTGIFAAFSKASSPVTKFLYSALLVRVSDWSRPLPALLALFMSMAPRGAALRC